jgi:hypothetical protein
VSFVCRNAVERIHFDAVATLGQAPESWNFENQLPQYRQISGPDWNSKDEAFIWSLKDWSLSRLELIGHLPLFYFAYCDVMAAQQMSADMKPLRFTPFTIATDPCQDVSAYLREHSSQIPSLAFENLFHVVWVNCGMLNCAKILAHHFAWALLRTEHDLVSFFRRVGNNEDVLGCLEALSNERRYADSLVGDRLRRALHRQEDRHVAWLAPAIGDLSAFSPEAKGMMMTIMRGMITFVVGHEMGHVYLGHTGFHPSALVNEVVEKRASEDPLFREIHADNIGLICVWDGLASGTHHFASIDVSWIGPALLLSMLTGLALNDDEQNTRKWLGRLYKFANNLVNGMRRTQFDSDRVGLVERALPVVSSAVVEWVRRESHVSGAPDINYSLPNIYSEMKNASALT